MLGKAGGSLQRAQMEAGTMAGQAQDQEIDLQ
jgi:hypothetical protein